MSYREDDNPATRYHDGGEPDQEFPEDQPLVIQTWTTAPPSYDGFGTQRIGVVGVDKGGREVWEVSTPEEHAQWQRDRYYSGGVYRVILTASDLQDQKDFGLVVVL